MLIPDLNGKVFDLTPLNIIIGVTFLCSSSVEEVSFNSFIYLFIYLIYGCVGSSFLCEGFL